MSMAKNRTIFDDDDNPIVLDRIPAIDDYSDGRTKQAFKNETLIDNILSRAEQAGTLSHLQKYEAQYGDFSDFDFQEHANKLARGRSIFEALPGEIREEFSNNPQKFFDYVNDENNEDIGRLLPGLARPGRQFIDITNPTPRTPPVDPADPDKVNQGGAREPQATGNQSAAPQAAAQD